LAVAHIRIQPLPDPLNAGPGVFMQALTAASRGARFVGADLRAASLGSVGGDDFAGADFTGADLSYAGAARVNFPRHGSSRRTWRG
jgi:hypothetical protein